MAQHIAILNAYPIKPELGAGFRGVFFVRATKARIASDRFDTLEQARHWCKVQADDAYADRGYTLAPLRRKGEYYANVWVA